MQSHQAEILIVKRLIQRNNVTRVQAELKSYDQGRREIDANPDRMLTFCHLFYRTERKVSTIH